MTIERPNADPGMAGNVFEHDVAASFRDRGARGRQDHVVVVLSVSPARTFPHHRFAHRHSSVETAPKVLQEILATGGNLRIVCGGTLMLGPPETESNAFG